MPGSSAYRVALGGKSGKMEPVEEAVVPVGHAVVVTPARFDSPDIIKVVVKRNGEIVPPIANELKPKVLSNRMGASTTLHAGYVLFPCSAFAPNGIGSITAIPETGTNL